MFDGLEWMFNLIVILAVIGLVFGIWKIVEIIIWVLGHIKII